MAAVLRTSAAALESVTRAVSFSKRSIQSSKASIPGRLCVRAKVVDNVLRGALLSQQGTYEGRALTSKITAPFQVPFLSGGTLTLSTGPHSTVVRSAQQGVRMQTSAPSLAYVVVFVQDVEKSVAFYEKAFGLKTRMTQGRERTAWAEMETGSTTLAFTPLDQREAAISGGVKSHSQEDAAPNVVVTLAYDDVHKAYKHAVESGAKACAEPEEKPWGMTVGYVKDIDGNLIRVESHMKQ